jgi:hypothetical protein
MELVRCTALLAAGVASLIGCELVAGIHDKTLSGTQGLPCSQEQDTLFCDDFDSVQDAGETWLWDTPEAGSTIEIDTTDYRTPPHSVQFFIPPTSPQAQLGKTLSTAIGKSVSLAFDLRVDVSQDEFGKIPEVSVAQILCAGNNTSINYVLGPGAVGKIYAYDTSNSGWSFTQKVDAPTPGAWTRIVLAYDATQGVTLTEDGTTLYADGPDAAVARGAAGSTDVIVGAVYVNPPGSANLLLEIDDVVVRGQ